MVPWPLCCPLQLQKQREAEEAEERQKKEEADKKKAEQAKCAVSVNEAARSLVLTDAAHPHISIVSTTIANLAQVPAYCVGLQSQRITDWVWIMHSLVPPPV